MVDFSNIMYNVVENIKGELALKKFGHVNDNENTVQTIIREMVEFLKQCVGGSIFDEKEIRKSIHLELKKYDSSTALIDQQMIQSIQSRVAATLKEARQKHAKPNLIYNYEEYSDQHLPLKSERYGVKSLEDLNSIIMKSIPVIEAEY